MTTSRARKSTPAEGNLQRTPEPSKVEPVGISESEKSKEPVNLEVETPSEEPLPAPEAVTSEEIQTDFRQKLAKKTDQEDIFVPSNPAALEKAAVQVAEESGFTLNRGTSIGARLIARSRKLA
jgi:outer membrane biosynthesis protein TonB